MGNERLKPLIKQVVDAIVEEEIEGAAKILAAARTEFEGNGEGNLSEQEVLESLPSYEEMADAIGRLGAGVSISKTGIAPKDFINGRLKEAVEMLRAQSIMLVYFYHRLGLDPKSAPDFKTFAQQAAERDESETKEE